MNRAVSLFLLLWSIHFCGCSPSKPHNHLRLRLQWFPQAQFAGYIVALEKGYYRERGLEVELLPAGPDLKPHQTVANGSDDIGIGVPNQVMTARANGVPLVAFAQLFQDSPNRYVLKNSNRIDSLQQLRGKEVGLWLGGDEIEFVAMLNQAGMDWEEVKVVPQDVSVVPFLQDRYILSQVTTYNELNLLEKEGWTADKLQILSPKDYQCAIPGDLLFCTETLLRDRPEQLTQFLEASLLGWQFALKQPEETVQILLAYNPELDADSQRRQLQAVSALLTDGAAATQGLGFIRAEDYATTERILYQTQQIRQHVPIEQCYSLAIWEKVSAETKRVER